MLSTVLPWTLPTPPQRLHVSLANEVVREWIVLSPPATKFTFHQIDWIHQISRCGLSAPREREITKGIWGGGSRCHWSSKYVLEINGRISKFTPQNKLLLENAVNLINHEEYTIPTNNGRVTAQRHCYIRGQYHRSSDLLGRDAYCVYSKGTDKTS